MVKKILISQPKPATEKSPYFDLADDCEVELVFRPFIKVEGVPAKDFRQQKVEISDYSAVIFTSRHAIDNYFAIAKEMRINIPETMKYFCMTEAIALYIQKYVQYRKRKVFFGQSGHIEDLLPSMQKHCKDNYLLPLSDVSNDSISQYLTANGVRHTQCFMYRTVSNDFTPEEIKTFDYDMLVFFSPAGIQSLKENFPGMKPGEVRIATFGPSTAQAAREAGFEPDVEAPSEKYPSMVGALRHYLLMQED